MLFPLKNSFTISTFLGIQLLLSLQFGKGDALMCYSCNGQLSPDLCEATKIVTECGPEDNVCLTFNTIIEVTEGEGLWFVVDRACGKTDEEELQKYIDGCMFSEVDDRKLSVCLCSTDLCELTPPPAVGGEVNASPIGGDSDDAEISSTSSDNDQNDQDPDLIATQPQVSGVVNLLFTILAFIALLVVIVLSDL